MSTAYSNQAEVDAHRTWLRSALRLTLPDALPGDLTRVDLWRTSRPLVTFATCFVVVCCGVAVGIGCWAIVSMVLLHSIVQVGRIASIMPFDSLIKFVVIATCILTVIASVVQETSWYVSQINGKLLALYMAYEVPGFCAGERMTIDLHRLTQTVLFAPQYRKERKRFLAAKRLASVVHAQALLNYDLRFFLPPDNQF